MDCLFGLGVQEYDMNHFKAISSDKVPSTEEHQILRVWHSFFFGNQWELLIIFETHCAFSGFKGQIRLFAAFFDEGKVLCL